MGDVYDMSNVCRLCLQKCESGIDLNSENNQDITNKLTNVFPEINLNFTYLSNIVCKECSSCIENAHAFKTTCLEVETMIQLCVENDIDVKTDEISKFLKHHPSVDKLVVNYLSTIGECKTEIDDTVELTHSTEKNIEPSISIVPKEELKEPDVIFFKEEYPDFVSDESINLFDSNSESSSEFMELEEENYSIKNNNFESNNLIEQQDPLGVLKESAGPSNSDLTRKVKPMGYDKKFYKCQLCNEKFTAGSSLARHLKDHDKKFPYKCYVCDKSFMIMKNLNMHLRTHESQQPCTPVIDERGANLKIPVNAHACKEKQYVKSQLHRHKLSKKISKQKSSFATDRISQAIEDVYDEDDFLIALAAFIVLASD